MVVRLFRRTVSATLLTVTALTPLARAQSMEPTPEPTPIYEPTPLPTATPEPTPWPTATPWPTPWPTPEPMPPQEPIPWPEPTPEATPEPTPEPVPEPTPEVTPEPTPQPTPEPTPEPTPVATPEPTPDVTPTPAPTPETPDTRTPEGPPSPTTPENPPGQTTPENPPGQTTPGYPPAEPTPEPTLPPVPTPTPPPSPTPVPTPIVDWAQPPVMCVEDIVPSIPDRPCLDLTNVVNPNTGWPENLSPEELAYWQNARRPLQYCRGAEVLRREELAPGTFPAGTVQVAYMQVHSTDDRDQKVDAVYRASRDNQLPAQVLAGALQQESLFYSLSISPDGSNYSCGIGQMNVLGWCGWANTQPLEVKQEIGWPEKGVNCSNLARGMVAPFYEIARQRMGARPEYRMTSDDFVDIALTDVVARFPRATDEIQAERFTAITSFVRHCAQPKYGIEAKGKELATIYRSYVPAGLKKRELYAPGEGFQKQCKDRGYEGAYPLHTGWLLAVASYNAGPRAVDAMAHYNQWKNEPLKNPETFLGFSPQDLVGSLYWAGRYNAVDDLLHFNLRSGPEISWIYFKTCVVQRHVARIAQHVTAANTPFFVKSVETDGRCAKSTFDSEGKLVKTSVPLDRQMASGVKDAVSLRGMNKARSVYEIRDELHPQNQLSEAEARALWGIR